MDFGGLREGFGIKAAGRVGAGMIHETFRMNRRASPLLNTSFDKLKTCLVKALLLVCCSFLEFQSNVIFLIPRKFYRRSKLNRKNSPSLCKFFTFNILTLPYRIRTNLYNFKIFTVIHTKIGLLIYFVYSRHYQNFYF